MFSLLSACLPKQLLRRQSHRWDSAVIGPGWWSLLEKLGHRSVVDLMYPRKFWKSSCTKENRESKWMVYWVEISWVADISSSGLLIYRWKKRLRKAELSVQLEVLSWPLLKPPATVASCLLQRQTDIASGSRTQYQQLSSIKSEINSPSSSHPLDRFQRLRQGSWGRYATCLGCLLRSTATAGLVKIVVSHILSSKI
jgi:hypothetical protein